MACGGCDARREWMKRKAALAAQTVAALLKLAEPKKDEKDDLARRQDNI